MYFYFFFSILENYFKNKLISYFYKKKYNNLKIIYQIINKSEIFDVLSMFNRL